MPIELWSSPRMGLELPSWKPPGKLVGKRNARRSLFPPPDGEMNGLLGWRPERLAQIKDWFLGVELDTPPVQSRSYLTVAQLARSVGVSVERLKKWVERWPDGPGQFVPPAVLLVWPKNPATPGWDPNQVDEVRAWSRSRTRNDNVDPQVVLSDSELVRLREAGMTWRELGTRGGVDHKTVLARYNKLTGRG